MLKNILCTREELNIEVFEFEDSDNKVITITNSSNESVVLSGKLATDLLNIVDEYFSNLKTES